MIFALFSPKRTRWFTGLGLAAFGLAWLWQRQHRLMPPLGLLADQGQSSLVEVGAGDLTWLMVVGRAVAPRRVFAVSGLVPPLPQAWLQRMEAAARRACLLERVTPLVADAGHLPLPDGQSGIVVIHDLLERLADRDARQRAVTEAVRILAPGGRLVIGEPRFAGEAATAMTEAGLGVRTVTESGTAWLVGTKGWV